MNQIHHLWFTCFNISILMHDDFVMQPTGEVKAGSYPAFYEQQVLSLHAVI